MPIPVRMRTRLSVAVLSVLVASALIALISIAPTASAQVPAGAGLLINEIVADNEGSLIDADGDTPDWIELRNPTADTVDLSLSYLSDSEEEPAQWRFPQGATLAPGGFLIVFASGKDRAVVGQELHTNFGLSANGESVVLTAPDGSTTIDVVTFGGLDDDEAYGRSGAEIGLLLAPTPGAVNSELQTLIAATPAAAVGSGLVEGAFVESLSSSTAGAEIRYTLDGSVPVADAALAVNGAVAVTPDAPVTTLRAVAFAAGHEPSPVATFTYIEPSIAAASVGGAADVGDGIRSLPVMSITTASGSDPAGEAAYEPARIDYIDQNGPGFSEEIGLKHFGNASLAHPKKNFRVNFSRDYGAPNLDYPLFADRGTDFFRPATEFDQLEIRAYSHDGFGGVYWAQEGSYLANEFGRLLSLELGSLHTHGRPVTVFVDGTFRGLYQLRERINADWMSQYFGGDGDDYESWVIDDRSGLNDLNSGDGSVLAAIGAATSYEPIRDLINADSLIASAMVLWNHSFYWEMEWRMAGPSDPSHPSGMHFFPNDLDLGFGGLYDPGRSPGPRDYLDVLDDDPEFLSLLQTRAAEAFCGTGPMSESAMLARFDQLKAEIAPAMVAEVEAWDHGSVAVWQQQTSAARANIPSGLETTRAEWLAAGWFLGCDRLVPQTVEQSSVFGNNVAQFGPMLANDARTTTFTATDLDAEARLDIDLGAVQSIDSIRVWNRADCCADRLTDFHVFVSDEPFVSTAVAATIAQEGVTDLYFPGQAGGSESFTVNRSGRYLRVQLAGTNYLSVGEVEIFGDPVDGDAPLDSVVLNEWNAVTADATIAGGDSTFGSVPGNGGDWFELLVTHDHLDLRGFRMELSDADAGNRETTDTFVLSDHPLLADLRAGSIITVAESVADDLSYDPAAGDWTINLQANSDGAGTLVTPGSQSNFDTNHSDWQLRILDNFGNVVSDHAGEGAGGASGIGSAEVGELKADPLAPVDRAAYGGSDASTFGASNRYDGRVQDLRTPRGFAPPVDNSDVQAMLDVLAAGANDLALGNFVLGDVDADGDGELTLLDAIFEARRLYGAG